jgi:hypothetical protein
LDDNLYTKYLYTSQRRDDTQRLSPLDSSDYRAALALKNWPGGQLFPKDGTQSPLGALHRLIGSVDFLDFSANEIKQ